MKVTRSSKILSFLADAQNNSAPDGFYDVIYWCKVFNISESAIRHRLKKAVKDKEAEFGRYWGKDSAGRKALVDHYKIHGYSAK